MSKLEDVFRFFSNRKEQRKSIGQNSIKLEVFIKLEVDKMTKNEQNEYLSRPNGMSIYSSLIKKEILERTKV